MLAKTRCRVTRMRVCIMPGAPRDTLANIDWQRRAALAKHFANKHQHGERRGDQRRAVKRETVAPGDMHRQHRRAVAACELHKTGVPDAVLDAVEARARHLACGKENQRAAAFKMRLHLFNGGFAGAVADVIHGNKERRQRLQMAQHPVRHHAHVAPHAGDGVEQRQPVGGAGRVVGDDNQRPVIRDLLKRAGWQIAANIEMLQHLLDHIEPFEMAMAGGELLKLLFIKQAFERFFQPRGGGFLGVKIVKNVVDAEHGCVSSGTVCEQ